MSSVDACKRALKDAMCKCAWMQHVRAYGGSELPTTDHFAMLLECLLIDVLCEDIRNHVCRSALDDCQKLADMFTEMI